jgi:hypothetical protein
VNAETLSEVQTAYPTIPAVIEFFNNPSGPVQIQASVERNISPRQLINLHINLGLAFIASGLSADRKEKTIKLVRQLATPEALRYVSGLMGAN